MNFRATRNSTIIAVVFSILSGASSLAGGDLPQIDPHSMLPAAISQLWQSAAEETPVEYLCSI